MKALVLGGKGAIGKAISNRLVDSGHEVLSVGRDEFDITKPEEIDDFFSKNERNFDFLINSCGYNVPKLFDALTDSEIRSSLDANLFGFLDVTRYCVPYWKANKFGRIVVLSSLYGHFGRSGRLPYVMSKHALNGAVKTLAIEMAPIGVLVNSVSPGYIATPLTFRNNTKADIEKLVSGIPLGRLGEPHEVANVVEFLCSNANSYISGQDLVVDGAFSAGGFQ